VILLPSSATCPTIHRGGVVHVYVVSGSTVMDVTGAGLALSMLLPADLGPLLAYAKAADRPRSSPAIPQTRRAAPPRTRWQRGRPHRRLLARGGRPARHSSWYGARLRGGATR
jgi:hypothetical protein